MPHEPAPDPTLADHDAAIWHTVDINLRLERGDLADRPRLSASFPPRHGRAETMLAHGAFALHDGRPGGDGRHWGDPGLFLVTGRGGLAGMGALALGRAISSHRRRVAEQAAAERWAPVDGGRLWVSTHCLYLRSPHGLTPWDYPAVTSAELVGPAQLVLAGESRNGPVRWLLRSWWAELAFTQWARRVHPDHPQFRSGGWIPAGWAERVRTAGHDLPSRGPAVAP